MATGVTPPSLGSGLPPPQTPAGSSGRPHDRMPSYDPAYAASIGFQHGSYEMVHGPHAAGAHGSTDEAPRPQQPNSLNTSAQIFSPGGHAPPGSYTPPASFGEPYGQQQQYDAMPTPQYDAETQQYQQQQYYPQQQPQYMPQQQYGPQSPPSYMFPQQPGGFAPQPVWQPQPGMRPPPSHDNANIVANALAVAEQRHHHDMQLMRAQITQLSTELKQQRTRSRMPARGADDDDDVPKIAPLDKRRIPTDIALDPDKPETRVQLRVVRGALKSHDPRVSQLLDLYGTLSPEMARKHFEPGGSLERGGVRALHDLVDADIWLASTLTGALDYKSPHVRNVMRLLTDKELQSGVLILASIGAATDFKLGYEKAAAKKEFENKQWLRMGMSLTQVTEAVESANAAYAKLPGSHTATQVDRLQMLVGLLPSTLAVRGVRLGGRRIFASRERAKGDGVTFAARARAFAEVKAEGCVFEIRILCDAVLNRCEARLRLAIFRNVAFHFRPVFSAS